MKVLPDVVFRIALMAAIGLAAQPTTTAADGVTLQSLSLSGNRGPQPSSREAPGLGSEVGITQKLGGMVPLGEPFQDEAGNAVSLATYLGARPLILVPAYYRCPILCSQVLGGLVGSLKGMSLAAGKDFQVVALSFDPLDSAAAAAAEKSKVVRRYGRPGSESGWHFLTGHEPEIKRVLAAIGYRYFYDARSNDYAHPAGFVVLTPDGRISRYFTGLDVAPRDLRFSLLEAAAGKIGTALDRLLLYCYRYDPLASKYGIRIMGALQVGGALTVVGLLLLLLALRYREYRGPKPGTSQGGIGAAPTWPRLDQAGSPAEGPP